MNFTFASSCASVVRLATTPGTVVSSCTKPMYLSYISLLLKSLDGVRLQHQQ